MRRNFCGLCRRSCAKVGAHSEKVADFPWQRHHAIGIHVAVLRVVMKQTLGPELRGETVEEPYAARDEQQQKHEDDGVHLHALAVIIVQPQVGGGFFGRPQGQSSQVRGSQPSCFSVMSQINNI